MAFEFLLNLVQGSNIILFFLIVLLLIIAFKILKTFIETLVVAVLSGFFYVILSNTGAPLEVNTFNVLFFSFVGGLLFLVYSLIAPVVSVIYRTISGSFKFLGAATRRRGGRKTGNSRDNENKKAIILKELDEDE